ncbi:ATPase domain protein, prokaryote domain protein [Candidatus Magnetomorum sp. HK-1]|nr:ATPase domain protein, prokaryote domain protein [Candidatus Magnetomorum sp. HK-1]
MKHKQAIHSLVPDEIYTDRQDFIDYLFNAAIDAIRRRTTSLVLLGQRRMGKTEIFKRVINKLFFEQDQRKSEVVVPVYYSFKEDKLDRWDFATHYAENFLRWYVAFHMKDTYILSNAVSNENLLDYIQNSSVEKTRSLDIAVNTYKNIKDKAVTIPEMAALTLPRTISDWDNSTIVMFLDEFQNVHLPQHNFRVAGFMQEAVESPTCPHFVTGSAMSILSNDILGRGSLFGRFRSKPITPFTQYFGTELSIKAASYRNVSISLEIATYLSKKCGGNPFYINSIVHQAAEQNNELINEEALNKMLSVDLSSGFIWGELHDQVSRWIERINDTGVTKWILYLSAMEEGERINIDRIKNQLMEKEGKDISIKQIKDILVKLSRGDLLEYMEFGDWFKKIDDPILLDFLKVWGKTEVEGLSQDLVKSDLIAKYNRLKLKIKEHIAYIAEIYMSQILWNSKHKKLSGKYFHSKKVEIKIPSHFVYIHHRVRLGASSDREIDVYASAGDEFWICESKYWNGKKVGIKQVESFLKLADCVKEFEGHEYFDGEKPLKLSLWLYAHDGVTKSALSLINKHDILWSDKNDLDALLKEVGLRKLSDIIKI